VSDSYPPILQGEHPDHPGWQEWRVPGEKRFNQAVLGLMLVRRDSDQQATVRIFPREMLVNLNDVVHGGAILALIDVAMFAGSSVLLGTNVARAVTVELTNHFLSPGDPARPLDAQVEVVRETGRMIFTRGRVVQEHDVVAAYSGILRKIAAP
jgi:uncharacterized protein (TIGR00369 family)